MRDGWLAYTVASGKLRDTRVSCTCAGFQTSLGIIAGQMTPVCPPDALRVPWQLPPAYTDHSTKLGSSECHTDRPTPGCTAGGYIGTDANTAAFHEAVVAGALRVCESGGSHTPPPDDPLTPVRFSRVHLTRSGDTAWPQIDPTDWPGSLD